MLADFLEVNGVDADLVAFPRATSLQTALFETKMPVSSAITVDFLMNEREEAFLIVRSIKSKPDLGKIMHATGSKELIQKSDEEVFEATGYRKEFLPPVGIYGVKVYLDSPLNTKDSLLCRVSDKEFLKIPPEEIVDSNEEAFVERISK